MNAKAKEFDKELIRQVKEYNEVVDNLVPQMGGILMFREVLSKEQIYEIHEYFGSLGFCSPSRANTLTGYNVTEEFKRLEKAKVEVVV